MVINDDWAEDELERQLRALSPIHCIEDAQRKLQELSRNENLLIDNASDEPACKEDKELPASAELYLSLIQSVSAEIETDLSECQSLIQHHQSFDRGRFSVSGESTAEEWEDELILTPQEQSVFQPTEENFVFQPTEKQSPSQEQSPSQIQQNGEKHDEDEEDNDEDILDLKTLTEKFKISLKMDLPIYQPVEILPKAEVIHPTDSKRELEEKREEEEKRVKERALRLEEEKRRLEKLQEEELRRIEREVAAAEAALAREVAEHERHLALLSAQVERERAAHEAAERARVAGVERGRAEAATRIQAHVRGMWARREHRGRVEERVKRAREERREAEVRRWEEQIRRERAEEEAERERQRAEEEERRRAEERAEELRRRGLEKERSRREEEERVRSEEERRRERLREEEKARERSLAGQQELHWLGSDQKTPASLNDHSPEPRQPPKPTLITDIDSTGKSVKSEMKPITAVEPRVNPEKSAVEPTKPTFYIELGPEIAETSPETMVAESPKPTSSPEAKPSFLSSLATKAKKLFKSTPSSDSSTSEYTIQEKASPELVPSGTDEFIDHGCKTVMTKDEEVKPPENISNKSAPAPTTAPEVTPSSLPTISDDYKALDHVPNPTVSKTSPSPARTSSPQAKTSSPPAKNYPFSVRTSSPFARISPIPARTASPPAKNNPYSARTSSPVQSVLSPLRTETAVLRTLSPSRLTASLEMTLPPVEQPLRSSADELRTLTIPPGSVALSPTVTTGSSAATPGLSTLSPTIAPGSSTVTPGSSTLSPAPPSTPSRSSEDAKAEYRRRRKLQNDLLFARELSVVLDEVPREEGVEDRSAFTAQLTTSHERWLSHQYRWSELPARPGTSSGRAPTGGSSYPVLRPRVVAGAAVVEGAEGVSVRAESEELFIRGSYRVQVDPGNAVMISVEGSRDITLTADSHSLSLLYQTDCSLTKLDRGTSSLLFWDLSRNDIHRLNPVISANLTVLNLSHNKLVSTRVLQFLPNLLHLDLSSNSLSTVQHLNTCGLLQHLDLSKNNLVNVPSLSHNILLTFLDLSDNGLTDVGVLGTAWLPLLSTLRLGGNVLSSLPSLHTVAPLLHSLDLSNNMLGDTVELLGCLEWCRPGELLVEGNAGLDLNRIYQRVTSSQGHVTSSYGHVTADTAGPLELHLIELQRRLRTFDIPHQTHEKVQYLRNRWELSKLIRDRCLEEGGREVLAECSDKRKDGAAEKDRLPKEELEFTGKPLEKPMMKKETERRDHHAEKKEKEAMRISENRRSTTPVKVSRPGDTPLPAPDGPKVDLAAAKTKAVVDLQCLVRGFSARLRLRTLAEQRRLALVREYRRLSAAALTLQRVWRGWRVRRDLWRWLPWLHRRLERRRAADHAATVLQALCRGWRVRRRIAQAYEAATYELDDLDDLDEVGSLNWDEEELDRGWGLPPTPSLASHASLPPTPAAAGGRSSARSHLSLLSVRTTPVPLLPLSRLRSRPPSAASLASGPSEISVLSLPSSKRTTAASRRQEAMVAEWGLRPDQPSAAALISRSRKLGAGKRVSAARRRQLVRERLLEEGAHRRHHHQSPPPPPSAASGVSSAGGGEEDVRYEWEAVRALHTRVYRNPRFGAPSGGGGGGGVPGLPPLRLKQKSKPFK